MDERALKHVYRTFNANAGPRMPSFSQSAFCNVFVAKSLCKFAARETELDHPRSDKSCNGQIGFHLKNPPSVRRRGGLTRG
jgi:hypothetical protein